MKSSFSPRWAVAVVLMGAATTVGSQAVVQWPGGRMAITSDGNAHDPDDIGGTPMAIALMASAGLLDELVHVDYANHFVHQGHEGPDSKPDMLKEISESVAGAVQRFGPDPKVVFNCQTQLDAAIANFVKEASRSSADDPLWFICAGPMTTANRYLEAVEAEAPEKLRFIHCVSHSANNGKHDPAASWERMKTRFPTVEYHLIRNQNSAGGEQGLCSPLEHWTWMKDSTNANLRWLYSRNRTAHANAGRFDVSDAGMVYFVISGAGNERAGVAELRDLLEPLRGVGQ